MTDGQLPDGRCRAVSDTLDPVRPIILSLVVVTACTQADQFVVSPDGRFSVALYQPAERVMRQPKTPAFAGWAELYGPFGLSCGRGHSLGLNRQPSGVVHWGANEVRVEGVQGYWTVDPCRYVFVRDPSLD